MTKQIKFRCWDGTMDYDPSGVCSGKVNESLNYHDGGEIWMQFTGLLDKNGKEIYESDIVIGSVGTWDGPFKVIFKFGAWELENVDGQGESLYGETVEVIGNIYTNSELLTNRNNEM